ncbi:putative zinc finger protein [Streptomyces sp. 840.1]|uniref:RskA family anti-sigma factor n=1 Tax=Streptomyces sp. 840.1 TaxID=2485152 RepID=UPI000FB93B87|nr:zf-HC2 domain-containing protein [Streptomyces sp. 840.1]ROQ59369.1 putative zinc finger protein [Streptomyces sp. 840.1]
MSDVHMLTGAYALDALQERERTAVEAHCAGCPPCLRECEEFRATAARLGMASTTIPPAALKGRVLDIVRATPRQPPWRLRMSDMGRRAAVRLRRRTLR